MTTVRQGSDGEQASGPARSRASLRAIARGAPVLLGWSTTVGAALAHSGHDHPESGGGGLLLPAALLFGSMAILGTSVYLDRAGEIEGWMARAGVLLGIVGLFAAALLVLF